MARYGRVGLALSRSAWADETWELPKGVVEGEEGVFCACDSLPNLLVHKPFAGLFGSMWRVVHERFWERWTEGVAIRRRGLPGVIAEGAGGGITRRDFEEAVAGGERDEIARSATEDGGGCAFVGDLHQRVPPQM